MRSLELRGVPRYVKLAEALRRDIARGKLKPGDRLPSFAETKARHGISQATWDKVHASLETEGLISREPGRGVFVAHPTVPDETARARTGGIGLAGYGFGTAGSSTYWAAILEGVREAIEAAGRRVILLPSEGDDGWESVEGAIVCYWTPNAARQAPAGVPLTWLLAPSAGMSGVAADEQGAMRALTQHLLRLGHRRIGYLHGRDMDKSTPRYRGYLQALQEAGVVAEENWRRALPNAPQYGSQFIRSGHAAMRRWLENGWAETGCTALLAHNDETAIGAIGAIREKGLSVPDDLSVAGFDGLEIGAYFSPSLTTMEVPLREIGARAAALLIEEIEGAGAGASADRATVTLPCVLQARGSTAPPAKTSSRKTASARLSSPATSRAATATKKRPAIGRGAV